MDWIDRYVAEVGRHLPEKTRQDIEKEIRSSLEDALEDRLQAEAGKSREDVILDLLKELGPPEKVAASYLPPRYLIGPRLYPTFITVLRIALIIVTALAAIGFGISFSQTARDLSDLGAVLFQTLAGIWSSIVQVFGIIVIVFAILERTLPKGIETEKAWDPRRLPAQPDPDRIKPGELVGETIFTLLALMILVFYTGKIGLYFFNESVGEWSFLPVLTAAFYAYVPWLALLWVLDIFRNALVLYQRRWTSAARWFSLGCNLYGLIVLSLMLTGPALVDISPQALMSLPGSEITLETAIRSNELLNTAVRLILGLLIGLEIFDLGKTLYRLIGKRISLTAN